MTEHERIIADIEKYGSISSGRSEYLKILKGQKPHLLAAVKAKCYDCCAYYEDGR